ncbi:unnamed protein product [Prunus armeniaca]
MEALSISFHPWIKFGLKFEYQVKACPERKLPNNLISTKDAFRWQHSGMRNALCVPRLTHINLLY